MKTKTYRSDSVVIETLEFDLFAVQRVTTEPFITMYAISSAWGYKLEVWQVDIVSRTTANRGLFDKWLAVGKELKAGTRPFPEWLKTVNRTVEVWR